MVVLYYIVSLHQTTTVHPSGTCPLVLYYIVSLHQTTTRQIGDSYEFSCIISFLYIKPQLLPVLSVDLCVVLYRFSTSNHNLSLGDVNAKFVVLYRFSTSNHNSYPIKESLMTVVLYRFSTSNHNQLCRLPTLTTVVLYRFSTSNHNPVGRTHRQP